MTHGPLGLTQEITTWKARAACAGYPNSVFFPSVEGTEAAEQALAVCSTCAVTEECLQYALETNQRSGVWGATTEDQRRSLRRKWLAARRRSA